MPLAYARKAGPLQAGDTNPCARIRRKFRVPVFPAMSNTIIEGQSKDFAATNKQERKAVYYGEDTPLSRRMSAQQITWLVELLSTRFQMLHNSMGPWREKMAKWERMSEDDFSDRKGRNDPINDSSEQDIFSDQNDTMGLSPSFNEFHFAQVKDDIFGTRPWVGATPEGKDDADLADDLTKHFSWKIQHSDVEPALIDALKISTWGGTAFVKTGFRREVESYYRTGQVAINVETGKPFLVAPDPETGKPTLVKERGNYIETAEELAALGISDEQKEWKEMDLEDTSVVYSNVTAAVIDWKDIAFETTACDLLLDHTDVFVRFRVGMIDAINRYVIAEEMETMLWGALEGWHDEARSHRDESEPEMTDTPERNKNPLCTLVEGFVRCAPFGDGKIVRLHVIFSPDLNALFRVDYMANVTPGGVLPVFPVRINRIPGRVFGRGYFEKYEGTNDAVDRQHNLITFRNRANAHVWTTFQPDALLDPEGSDVTNPDPRTPFKLAPDKTIDDLIQFKAAPDTNGRSENLLNQMIQVGQMRSGITSAAQGEISGVPSSDTATGTKDLQSRGAVIIKSPITEQTEDIRKAVECLALLLYANQDTDETFTWSEGRAPELISIKAEEVTDLKMNVSLRLTQAQNREKLEKAMAAMNIIMQWLNVPEMEKTAVRPLFVQALSSLGFHAADDIIRQAVVDPASLLQMLPPEMAAMASQAFINAGIIAPQAPATPPDGQSPAPVSATPPAK